jgi:LacI family transcriptional regulator/LacI family repressor for deo operon, udp, cdd, tsx, nupC, and nupG
MNSPDDSIRRITIRDIAAQCGVHFTTVSRALGNHPSIPEKTRRRVQAAAKKLGYVPDPMMGALMAYRSRRRPQSFQGTLAWLTNNEPPFNWKTYFLEYYEGAEACAKRYGFNIEVFDLQTPGMNARRLAGILRSRGITGILVVPQPHPHTELRFPWENFSAVTFGYSLAKPCLHTVVSTQFRGQGLAMRELKAAGFEKIGFIFSPEHNERASHNYLAGYLVEEYLRTGEIRIPPLTDMRQFRAWYDKYRPEVIIASDDAEKNLRRIREAGLRVPQDVGFVSPLSSSRDAVLSGVYENSIRIGEAAMNLLVAMIRRGETGVPDTPQQILIPGIWKAGTTIQARPRLRPQR